MQMPDRTKTTTDILRCAAAPVPMKIILFIHSQGYSSSKDLADHVSLTRTQVKAHLSRMRRLGILFKETITSHEVDWVLTYDGIAVAKCLAILTTSLHKEKEGNGECSAADDDE